jgi:transcriptional regulator with XRE-family HTH domain
MDDKVPVDLHEVDVRVGSRIREARKRLGLTQRSLADLVGVTAQQIQKYEKGANRVSVPALLKFCKILSIAPDYFFGEHIPNEKGTDDFDDDLAITIARLLRKIKNQSVKNKILELIVSIAKDD